MDEHWHRSAKEIREALIKENQDQLYRAAEMARQLLYSFYLGGQMDSKRLQAVLAALSAALDSSRSDSSRSEGPG